MRDAARSPATPIRCEPFAPAPAHPAPRAALEPACLAVEADGRRAGIAGPLLAATLAAWGLAAIAFALGGGLALALLAYSLGGALTLVTVAAATALPPIPRRAYRPAFAARAALHGGMGHG